MKYIYELTWTNKIKKHEILECIKIGGVNVIRTELLGVVLFKKSLIKHGHSYLFNGLNPLKSFKEKGINNNINEIKIQISLTENKLNDLKKNLINSEKRKKETEMFIENEIKLIKKQYEKDI